MSSGRLIYSAIVAVCVCFVAAGHQAFFEPFGKEASEYKYNYLRIYHLTKKLRLSSLCFILLTQKSWQTCNHGNTSPTVHISSSSSCPGLLKSSLLMLKEVTECFLPQCFLFGIAGV